ncbi:neuropilin-1-like [Lampetra fluviatilis]
MPHCHHTLCFSNYPLSSPLLLLLYPLSPTLHLTTLYLTTLSYLAAALSYAAPCPSARLSLAGGGAGPVDVSSASGSRRLHSWSPDSSQHSTRRFDTAPHERVTCGGTLREPRGSFTSPNYPRHYANSAFCVWVIEALPFSVIVLEIVDMELELFFDSVTLSENQMATDAEFNGYSYKSFSNTLIVKFKSDLSVTYRGFNASYNIITYADDYRRPLGMESGLIPDDIITASSESGDPFLARNARINSPLGYWRPRQSRSSEFLQIDFRSAVNLTGMILQGSSSELGLRYGVRPGWVTALLVTCIDAVVSTGCRDAIAFYTGLVDAISPKITLFRSPIFVHGIRLTPLSWENEIALRIELLSPYSKQGSTEITYEPLKPDGTVNITIRRAFSGAACYVCTPEHGHTFLYGPFFCKNLFPSSHAVSGHHEGTFSFSHSFSAYGTHQVRVQEITAFDTRTYDKTIYVNDHGW